MPGAFPFSGDEGLRAHRCTALDSHRTATAQLELCRFCMSTY